MGLLIVAVCGAAILANRCTGVAGGIAKEQARRLLKDRAKSFSAIVGLVDRWKEHGSDDACDVELQALAMDLGAYRGERRVTAFGWMMCLWFGSFGIPQGHVEMICWLDDGVADAVEVGKLRLGSEFEALRGGWYWVVE